MTAITKTNFPWIIGGAIVLVVIGAVAPMHYESIAKECTDSIIKTQLDLINAGQDATVPPLIEELVDRCVSGNLGMAAVYLSISSIASAVLGALLPGLLRLRPSVNISAHYEPDARRLVLRFDKPVVAHDPQRMVLLYRHADGMASAMPGLQCKGVDLTLAFIIDVGESPKHMELVVCHGAVRMDKFPRWDICINGTPIHIDVDILHCDK